MTTQTTPKEGLGAALAVSFGLLGAFAIQKFSDLNSMMFSSPIIDSALEGPVWNARLGLNLALFAAALIALHIGFAMLGWLMGHVSRVAWTKARATPRQWTLLWMLAAVGTCVFASAGGFPSTVLARDYGEFARMQVIGMPLYRILALLLWTGGGATILVAAVRLMQRWRPVKRLPQVRLPWVAAAAAGVAIAFGIALPAAGSFRGAAQTPESTTPNIIFIGIDSLRTDVMPVAGDSDLTPNLNKFLGQATRFSDATTPLARTFPSWVSLLTGRHPHTSGAFNNLLPRDLVDARGNLADILRGHGYRTTYASDEVRFSNIDASYGFDSVVTPPIGATEFILAVFSDAPLLNVTVNTRLGGWLFPHLHANRGAAKLYDPASFIKRLEREIKPHRPAFVATHLTLSHWPYYWSDAERPDRDDLQQQRIPDFYLEAVRKVDEQFGDLWEVLERKGLLQDAWVVVFSDHGESFKSQDDSLVPFDSPEILRVGAKPTWGHGSSVLSPHQYSVVLAAGRVMGGEPVGTRRIVNAPVSIEDVTPTVLDLLGLSPQGPIDGRSLRPWLENAEPDASFAGRVRFTETEFNPKVIAAVTGQLHTEAIGEMSQYYRVDPDTDRVEVKRKFVLWMRRNRQFAAIGQTQLLAAVPSAIDGRHLRLLVPLNGGLPKRVEQAPDPSTDAEAAMLWQQLEMRYGAVMAEGLDRSRPLAELSLSDAARHPLTQIRGN